MIFIRGDYQINTDKDKLQIEVIHRYLTDQPTGLPVTLEMTKKTIEHSLCFGVYHRATSRLFSDRHRLYDFRLFM